MANLLPGLSSLLISLWIGEGTLFKQKTLFRDLVYHSRKTDCPIEAITSKEEQIYDHNILKSCLMPDLSSFRGQHDITPQELIVMMISNCESEACHER